MNWSPRTFRWALNLYPPYWATGITVERISPDWREMDVAMHLRFYNRNYFGSHFGGSLYSMIDPHYVLLLAQVLGRDYRVLDQGASIRFERPGTGTVRASFRITDALLTEIESHTTDGSAFRPVLPVEIVDGSGKVVARAEKTLYLKRREHRS